MSTASQTDGKKWIQSVLAVVCILLGYILINFFEYLSTWFNLEAKIPYYIVGSQVVSVVAGIVAYFVILTNPKSSIFCSDVFQELTKVVWPDKNQTVKYAIVIMIAVTIVGFIFGFFDFSANWLLGLINK
jgi:preprotein translocase SecE subunit